MGMSACWEILAMERWTVLEIDWETSLEIVLEIAQELAWELVLGEGGRTVEAALRGSLWAALEGLGSYWD